MLSVTAVGGSANPSAAVDLPIDPTLLVQKKKKKKRSRDSDVAEGSQRKKSRKHHDAPSTAEIAQGASESTEEQRVSGKRKKRKRRDREKSPASNSDTELQAKETAAALFSAIMAAAGSQPPLPPPPPQVQHPPFPPALVHPSQFLPYGAMPYPYHLVPQPIDPTVNHPSNIFVPPPPPGAPNPFADLNFESNEDVLRAFQDLDVTKLTNVIRSLSDATGSSDTLSQPPSAGPSSLFSPSFMNPTSTDPSLPLFKQVPTSSGAILGKKGSNGQQRPAFVLEDNQESINPEHAHLLATKWLNAGKLAELVRDEGQTPIYPNSLYGLTYVTERPNLVERYLSRPRL